ncbi:hypothetical protein HanRHA438_Chr08g0364231 [Helianthus annuus]|uniref:Uncharacterized protein n=1 Tax=Helianthus annuus TaxID=4232 RepID=A0A9K3IH51_HELAN|nr:hypothetical protein HanXRQr2_Chr08g0352001 [Helianthus annuus]KAJ0899083.1 hypothetical protein HanRHA438_Chr08g0364231 [Helianthus annuus]KAJ0902682.1 hypothetical protein HanPSC8_Chr08g0339921 [Helianthus annuus]
MSGVRVRGRGRRPLVSTWCRLPPVFAFEARDLLNLHRYLRDSRKWKKILQLITHTAIGCIWKYRNDLIFNKKKQINLARMLEEMELSSFFWSRSLAKATELT